jgi:hypothetical protein
MSGSWVGRPSWMTAGVVPVGSVDSALTCSSLHGRVRGKIY